MTNHLSTLTSSKTAIWNTRQIAFFSNRCWLKALDYLQMIRNNIFTHFAKQRGLILLKYIAKRWVG